MYSPITRRAFLVNSVYSLAGLNAAREFGPFKIGVQTYCFRDLSLDGLISRVKSLGLGHIEFFEKHVPVDSSEEQIAAVKARLDAAKIQAVSIYTGAFTAEELKARQIFEFARKMDFRFLNGGHRRNALSVLNRLVREYKVGVAIHNHGPGAPYDKLEDVTSVLDQYEYLSACIDVGHFTRSGVNPAEAVRKIGWRAVEVHIKDLTAKDENTVVGTGRIDMAAVFAALKEIKFDGLLTLEYEGDWDNMEARMSGMRNSLLNIQTLTGRK